MKRIIKKIISIVCSTTVIIAGQYSSNMIKCNYIHLSAYAISDSIIVDEPQDYIGKIGSLVTIK